MEKKTKEAAAYNEVIVQEILNYQHPKTLLTDDEVIEYANADALRRVMLLEQRDTTNQKYTDASIIVMRYLAIASDRFAERYKAYPAEIVEAFRRKATATIIRIRTTFESILQEHGIAALEAETYLQDYQDANGFVTDDIANFISMFNDWTLRDLICRPLPYIVQSNTIRGVTYPDIARTLKDLLAHKWTLGEQEQKAEICTLFLPTTSIVSTTKPDIAGMWGIHGDQKSTDYITCPNSKAYITVELDFDALAKDPALSDVVRALTPYDRRVFIAATTLQKNGYPHATLSKIYNAMGYTGKLGNATRDNIRQSMEKMAKTAIRFSNPSEVKAGERYTDLRNIAVDWDWVLPVHGVWIKARHGKDVYGYSFDRESVLMRIAYDRKQVTTIASLLMRPTGKRLSEDRLLVEDTLRDWLVGMKHKGLTTCRINLDTVLEKCGHTNSKDRKRKARLINFAEEALDAWKEYGTLFIDWEWDTSKDGKQQIYVTLIEESVCST